MGSSYSLPPIAESILQPGFLLFTLPTRPQPTIKSRSKSWVCGSSHDKEWAGWWWVCGVGSGGSGDCVLVGGVRGLVMVDPGYGWWREMHEAVDGDQVTRITVEVVQERVWRREGEIFVRYFLLIFCLIQVILLLFSKTSTKLVLSDISADVMHFRLVNWQSINGRTEVLCEIIR